MVREKDVCWEFAEKLDGNKVRCRFCYRILNGGISRLKHHLSRLPSKGVNPCSKVRDDVADRVRAILTSKEEGKDELSLSKKRRRLTEAADDSLHVLPVKNNSTSSTFKSFASWETSSPAAKLFPSLNQSISSAISNNDDRENAERSIALFFFENNLDFSVARSSSYHQMIEAVGKCGPMFPGPSTETLKEVWLDRIKHEVVNESKDVEKEWGTTGCTIIADTWTDNKSRAVINFFVSSPARTFFYKSVDAAASLCLKNTKYVADVIESVIQDFGPENVVQVILDGGIGGGLSFTGVGNQIMHNYGTVFVSPCASHCVNSVLEEFCRIDWVNRCIAQAQSITKFIYNNSVVLELMKKYTGGQELIKTGITKWVSNFLSLNALFKQRSRLKAMFSSPEYSSSLGASSCVSNSYNNNNNASSKQQSMYCISVLEDNEFWRSVEECVAVSEPFLRVLREVGEGKAAVGFLYEMMTKAKESIRTYYIMDECKCKVFSDIVEKKWLTQLHTPLHSAAAFLNPSIQFNPEVKFISAIKEDFFKVLEKLLPTPEMRRDITTQILLFTRATGMFGCNLAKEARDTVPPGLWWEQFGDSAPVLQRVAIRILSQVCSTYTLDRQWTTFQQIHYEKRNKIDKDMFSDLVYINSNLKLTTRKAALDSDPTQCDDIDMSSEWVEEMEALSPPTTQWLDRFGSALDCGDLNTRQFGASIFGANDHIFGL